MAFCTPPRKVMIVPCVSVVRMAADVVGSARRLSKGTVTRYVASPDVETEVAEYVAVCCEVGVLVAVDVMVAVLPTPSARYCDAAQPAPWPVIFTGVQSMPPLVIVGPVATPVAPEGITERIVADRLGALRKLSRKTLTITGSPVTNCPEPDVAVAVGLPVDIGVGVNVGVTVPCGDPAWRNSCPADQPVKPEVVRIWNQS